MQALAALTSFLVLGADLPGGQRLTMEQAVQMAIEASPALAAGRARARGSQAQAKSVRGHLLPVLTVSDELQRWDSPFDPTLTMPPPAPASSFRARDLTTNMLVVAAGQPLLGLLHLSSDHHALSAAAAATDFDLQTMAANLRDEIRTEFIRMFEARALAGVAQSAQAQLGEQLAVAKEKLGAGVLTPADVLRLDVAVANARQQEIQAQAAEQIARSSLLVALGREPQDTSLDFVEPATLDTADNVARDLAPLVAKATESRSEVHSARLAAAAAAAHARSRSYALLPDLDLEAGYMHSTGQTFVKSDSAFVGLRLNWQIWDWGARWYQRQQAEAQAEAARAQSDETRRRIQTEVAAKLANVRATASALETGRTAIGSAEEAYRVTTVLLAAGSANTTDLLDAQSALTQARLNFARARYEYSLARMSLARALGD
jgi:outer membrane protein